MKLIWSAILCTFFLLIASCRKQWGFGHPRDKAMEYYDKNFVLPDSSKLRTDGIYYHIYQDEYGKSDVSVYQFHKNGKLRGGALVNSTLKIRSNMFETSEIRGYYKFDGDSLRFTKDAHYYKKTREIVGYLSEGILYLKYKKSYFENQNKGFEPYSFIQNGKVPETGIDEKRYE
ncbi:MAG: hypothetical protein NVV82_13055 [Sporocytophaga sp.]|nr:hypothetical protein [Sporocytophaga sp.]